jgi:peroxiredoxin Q/BCP
LIGIVPDYDRNRAEASGEHWLSPDHPTRTSSCQELSMAEWLEPGTAAPAFSLKDGDGKTVKLSDHKGKVVVLYFYPKDDTPGCTKEACNFRDRHAELTKAGAVVLGMSPDDVASHRKFSDKFELNFPLLADPDHAVAEAYGAWREKNMYGKKSMGIQRSTYLIDAKGKIAKVWKKVSVDGHDAEVLEAIAELNG